MGSKSYSKGISWFDDCRIPFVDETDPNISRYAAKRDSVEGMFNRTVGFKAEYDYKEQTGRFPANLLVSDDMLNDGVVSKGIKSNRGGAIDSNSGTYSWNEGNTKNVEKYLCGFNDKGSSSRYYDIDKWFNNLLDV
jgi:hypothetical protein